MAAGYLLDRVLLKFKGDELHQDLSAALIVGEHLWVASDETTSIERLTRSHSGKFSKHQSFNLTAFFEDFREDDGEVDIEGLTYEDNYLWVIGSHSTKRKLPKGENAYDLQTLESERNRYLLARIPLIDGELYPSYKKLTAACLDRTANSNPLLDALRQDSYFAPFLPEPASGQKALPGKDNGLDIEGLTICQNKLLIGLRGPVLRGMAVLLEIKLEAANPGQLQLKQLENGQLYKKHFVDLNGLGIRDLCADGKDLLILAGPTMELDGTLRVFRLKDAFKLPANSVTKQPSKHLEVLFDIPYGVGCDRAEGLSLFSGVAQTPCALIVYDSPHKRRVVNRNHVLADLFTLE